MTFNRNKRARDKRNSLLHLAGLVVKCFISKKTFFAESYLGGMDNDFRPVAEWPQSQFIGNTGA